MTISSSWRRIAFPVAAVAAVLLLVSTLSDVLLPVLIAALAAVILHPIVDRAARFGMPRLVVVTLLYLALAVGLIAGTSGLGVQFQSLGRALQGEEFFGDLDGDGLIRLADVSGGQHEFLDLNGNGVWDGGAFMSLQRMIETERGRLPAGPVGETLYEFGGGLLDLFAQLATPSSGMISSGIEGMATWAGGVFELALLIVLTPFYLFFFLLEFPQISSRLRQLVPPRHRDVTERMSRDIGKELVAFLRGRLACGLIKALMLWVGMLVLEVPFALPIALVTGLLSLVPFLGFLAGVVPASVLALTAVSGGPQALVYVVILFVAAEAFEGAVLFPVVLGKETGLHPVTLIVVLLAGGAVMGPVGVLAAVPLALVIKVLWREVFVTFYQEWAFPEEAPRA